MHYNGKFVGPVAQLAEQQTLNLRVGGSIPPRLTTFSFGSLSISSPAVAPSDRSLTGVCRSPFHRAPETSQRLNPRFSSIRSRRNRSHHLEVVCGFLVYGRADCIARRSHTSSGCLASLAPPHVQAALTSSRTAFSSPSTARIRRCVATPPASRTTSILAHDRRQIVHVAVIAHPTAAWTAQQLRNAFPENEGARYLLHDRDLVFAHVATTLEAMNIQEVRTAPRAPWQNAYVERVIGSIRRECLDHVIVVNAVGLHRVLTDYWRTTCARAHISPSARTHQSRAQSHRCRPDASSPHQESAGSTIDTTASPHSCRTTAVPATARPQSPLFRTLLCR